MHLDQWSYWISTGPSWLHKQKTQHKHDSFLGLYFSLIWAENRPVENCGNEMLQRRKKTSRLVSQGKCSDFRARVPVEPPRRNTYASWHWWGSSHPCTAPWWTCWFCPAPPHGPWFCPWSRGCPGSTRWTPAGVVPFFKPDSLALERRREGN